MNLSEEFWDNRYKSKEIDWDLGEISTPFKLYIDQLTNKNIKILIPGGGNSYEAEYLHYNGFKNVFVVDMSRMALGNIKKRVPTFPLKNLIHSNFFDLQESFDLVFEQTFFCAINPNLRNTYVQKMDELLRENGKIVGLLFKVPLYEDHPPFGGNKEEYIKYFTPNFNIDIMVDCYNSVESRADIELFIKLVKK
ncbi:MAG: SAM-dependent methyltransferase [Lutibacter sp.]|nr:MAG: SAM-dependent methyltransferase [Lutibacter sp.]